MIEVLRIEEVKKQIADETSHLENVKLKLDAIKESVNFVTNKRNDLYHDCVMLTSGYYMFENENEDDSAAQSSLTNARKSSYARVTFHSHNATIETPELAPKGNLHKVKSFFTNILQYLVLKLRHWSRSYRFILNEMNKEKKTLKAALTPDLSESSQVL